MILYGPPAAGKDTITLALQQLNPIYIHFPKLKTGTGRMIGYQDTTYATLQALRIDNKLVWENKQYGNVYAVDRLTLLKYLIAETIPVLHLGQREAINAVINATPTAHWLIVSLWCPRNVAEERMIERDTGDTIARLLAWDETEPLPDADLAINTADCTADEAARSIHKQLTNAS